MPRFESSAARKLPEPDHEEISGVRPRTPEEPEELLDADVATFRPLEPEDLTAADVRTVRPELGEGDIRTGTVEDLPELPSADLDTAEDGRIMAEASKKHVALRNAGKARRQKMVREMTDKAEEERQVEVDRTASLREAIARGRASAAEPVGEQPVPAREYPEGYYLTKAQAYDRITKRFGEIANEHRYLTSLKQNKNIRESLAELDAESKELSEWMERVNQTPIGERVANPFAEADLRAAQAEEDRRAERRATMERSMSPEELRNWYDSLKQQYDDIESSLHGLDTAERGVIEDIKQITELTSQAREALRAKRAEGLASLLGERFHSDEERIVGMEELSRKGMRALRYPEMLAAIQDGRDHLETKRTELIKQFYQYQVRANGTQ